MGRNHGLPQSLGRKWAGPQDPPLSDQDGLTPGEAEVLREQIAILHRRGQPSRQRDNRSFHAAVPGDLLAPAVARICFKAFCTWPS
jgi:hypothetical protein